MALPTALPEDYWCPPVYPLPMPETRALLGYLTNGGWLWRTYPSVLLAVYEAWCDDVDGCEHASILIDLEAGKEYQGYALYSILFPQVPGKPMRYSPWANIDAPVPHLPRGSGFFHIPTTPGVTL